MKRNYPRIDIDDLTAVIRASIASQTDEDKVNGAAVSSETNGNRPTAVPSLNLQPSFQPRSDNRYHVNDLLRYHDRAFVQSAYVAILKRSPSAAESERNLIELRSGRLNKIDLLAALRFSVEGRAKRVQIDGLTVPAVIRRLGRLPIVGYAIRLAIAFVRLPKLVASQREFAGYVLSQNQQIADFINATAVSEDEWRHQVSRSEEALSKRLDSLSNEQQLFQNSSNTRFSALEQQLSAGLERLAGELAGLKQHLETLIKHEEAKRRAEMDQLIAEQQAAIAEVERFQMQLQQVRTELTLQGRSINTMVGPGKDTWSPAPSDSGARATIDARQLDALYAALEDRFRGKREEVKERFKFYLQFVKADAVASVLDIGCGRGEWLELLREDGIKAIGIDTNRVLLEQCRERGLEVIEADALDYLRGLPDKSLGAVTGFHIIEHVEIDKLLALLDEAMRVLVPGGVAIFETPNPDNVLVGSHYFYFDPTHHHPLPSQLMHFLFETRGFQRIEVFNLHPWETARVKGGGELAERFNDYFFGPMDYAILGWKN